VQPVPSHRASADLSGLEFWKGRLHPEPYMIQLTRLNNHPLSLNSDLIKFVEQSPDTVITLVTGEKIIVLENAQQVLDRVIQFRRSVLQGIMLWWDNRSALSPALVGESRPVVDKNKEK
jgi:flagellar protein FlbD